MYEHTYIVDSNGTKKAVVIDIDLYNELIEELEDLKDILKRKDEELIEHNEVKKMFLDE